MAADLTSTAQVEALWQPVPTAQAPRVTALIGMASRRIRAAFPDIDARIASGGIDVDLVSDVATAMVVRVLRNPEGLREVSVDDYRAVRDSTLSSGELGLTDAELELLAPTAAAAGGLGTIVPSWGDRC